MLKQLPILVACFAFAQIAWSDTNVGLVYGSDTSMRTDHGTSAVVQVWIAGTEAGPLLDHFQYIDDTTKQPSWQFVASRARSFKGYIEPFFGKVADFWLDGLQESYPGQSGRPMVAHVVMTDPSAGTEQQIGFFLIEIFDARNLNTPTERVLANTNDRTHVLISDDAGGMLGATVSDTGLAYSNDFFGYTTRYEMTGAEYNVSSNGLANFVYESKGIVFRSARLKSFHCTNTGFVGKEADFWLRGYLGAKNLTLANAHVIVTQSNAGFEFLYIALYDPVHPGAPTYERLVIRSTGGNHILCK